MDSRPIQYLLKSCTNAPEFGCNPNPGKTGITIACIHDHTP
jgi:hypothetical protein